MPLKKTATKKNATRAKLTKKQLHSVRPLGGTIGVKGVRR